MWDPPLLHRGSPDRRVSGCTSSCPGHASGVVGGGLPRRFPDGRCYRVRGFRVGEQDRRDPTSVEDGVCGPTGLVISLRPGGSRETKPLEGQWSPNTLYLLFPLFSLSSISVLCFSFFFSCSLSPSGFRRVYPPVEGKRRYVLYEGPFGHLLPSVCRFPLYPTGPKVRDVSPRETCYHRPLGPPSRRQDTRPPGRRVGRDLGNGEGRLLATTVSGEDVYRPK